MAIAIFLTEDFLPRKLEIFFKNIIELLAAIPSVVYGLWGIFVVIPTIRPACNWLLDNLGWVPIFGSRLSGPGMLPAALVLAIMVLPTITAVSRDALASVPNRAARGCLRAGRDQVGDDPGRDSADGIARHLRLDHPRLRPSPR